jgi:dTDP-4-dehydrorhamnose reductase
MTSFDFARVLTTGASGMIGSYVDFGIRPSHAEFDVTDESAVMRYVQEHRPQVILHLAGATDMARCEKEPAYAYELNVRGTYNVARAAHAVDATMVYASTSRVFKGDKETPYTEDDIPEPETHYGRTKHIGEIITASIVPRHIIARTAWVFGGGPERDNKFFGKVLKQLAMGAEIVALDDVRGSPTHGKDFVVAIKELLTRDERGIFHIANAGSPTRFAIAQALAAQLKSSLQVRAVDRSYFATGATLPINESISSKALVLRPWQAALIEYVRDEWASYLKSAKISV